MAKEHFFHKGTYELLDLLDEAARKGATSRGRAFEDFLDMSVAALSGGQLEEQYLKVVQRYVEGEAGQRGVDRLAALFGKLVEIMEETRSDILGDLFQGAITFGENGQFYTPEPVCDLMAQMVGHDEKESQVVCDPCCGSGRMLLSAAKVNRNRFFVGQDIDLRCVRMTAINLALRNLYGQVTWGNSLSLEQQPSAYRTGFNGEGFLQEVQVEPANASALAATGPRIVIPEKTIVKGKKPVRSGKQEQGTLFDDLEE